jgi:hypothetical protein
MWWLYRCPPRALTSTVLFKPPARPLSLLVPRAEPSGPPTECTLRGLVQSVRDYQTTIDFCDAQLDALRLFFKTR